MVNNNSRSILEEIASSTNAPGNIAPIINTRKVINHLGRLREGAMNSDPNVVGDLSGLLYETERDASGGETFNISREELLDENPFACRVAAENLSREYTEKLIDQVSGSFTDVLDYLRDERLVNLGVEEVKPTENGDDERDAIVELHNTYLEGRDELREMRETLENGDFEAIRGYLVSYLDRLNSPAVKETMAYIIQRNPKKLVDIKSNSVNKAKMSLVNNFIDDNDNLDKNKLVSYVDTNVSSLDDDEAKDVYIKAGTFLHEQ